MIRSSFAPIGCCDFLVLDLKKLKLKLLLKGCYQLIENLPSVHRKRWWKDAIPTSHNNVYEAILPSTLKSNMKLLSFRFGSLWSPSQPFFGMSNNALGGYCVISQRKATKEASLPCNWSGQPLLVQ